MSTSFGVRGTTSPKLAAAADTIADYTGQVSRYLTDGVTLYWLLAAVASGIGEIVGLREGRSLDVTGVAIGQLRARRLRAVNPAAGD
jgi:hypothetical protein